MALHLLLPTMLAMTTATILLTGLGCDAAQVHLEPQDFIATKVKAASVCCLPEIGKGQAAKITRIDLYKNEDSPIVSLRDSDNIWFGRDVPPRFQARGHIDQDARKTYLNITIHKPNPKDTGTYTCKVSYQDRSGNITQTVASSNLRVEKMNAASMEPLLSSVSDNMESMRENHEKLTNLNDKVIQYIKALETSTQMKQTSCTELDVPSLESVITSLTNKITEMVKTMLAPEEKQEKRMRALEEKQEKRMRAMEEKYEKRMRDLEDKQDKQVTDLNDKANNQSQQIGDLKEKVANQSKQIAALCDEDWVMVFRGTQGIGVSVLDSWNKVGHDDMDSITDASSGCLSVDGRLPCDKHARSRRLDDWNNIKKVKFELYTDAKSVFHVTFTATGSTDRNDVFNMKKIIDSSVPELIGYKGRYNFASVDGFPRCSRHFFLNVNFGGCPNDRGWLMVSDYNGGQCCSLDRTKPYPNFLYTKTDANILWVQSGDVGSAQVFAVFIKYK